MNKKSEPESKAKNRLNSFIWWRELRPNIRKSLVNEYYPGTNFFEIDSNIDRIEEMYIEEKRTNEKYNIRRNQ